MSAGRVESVYLVRRGTSVSTAVAGDGIQTVVQVGYSDDFAESGGQLVHDPTGDIYDYQSADPDAETITLAAPLPAGKTFAEDDALDVYPVAHDLYAQVRLDDGEDEAISARVPHSLRGLLPEGVRDPGAGEPVTLDAGAEEWVVTDLVGSAPLFDGGYIDPTTLPEHATDGLPPTASPTPTVIGGVGALHIRWAAISNPDPPTYEVHVSPVDGFTPDASTLVAETPGTSATVRALPDGTPLVTSVTDETGATTQPTYYVRLVARDTDPGTAPASAQVSGVLHQVTTEMVSAFYAYLGEVVADQITSGTLSADVTMSGLFKTADSGRRVEVGSDGVTLLDAGNQPLVQLPTDPAQPAKFSGEAQMAALVMTGPASLGSTDLQQNSTLTLQSSLQAPSNPPAVVVDWEWVQWADDGDWPERRGWSSDGTASYTANRRTRRIEKWDNTTRTKVAESLPNNAGYSRQTVTYGGGWVWLLQWGGSHWTVSRFSPTDLSWSGWEDANIGPNQQALTWDSTNRDAGVGYDESTGQILFAHSRSQANPRIWFRAADWTTSSITLGGSADDEAETDENYEWHVPAVMRGTFDHGARAWVATPLGATDDKWRAFAAGTAARLPALDWDLGFTENRVGGYYTASPSSAAGRFHAMTESGREFRYLGGSHTWSDTGAGKSWQAAYTWRSPTAQTTRSADTRFTMRKRARVRVASPGPYPAGGPDGAKFYLRPYTADTTLGTYYYQGESTLTTPVLTVTAADFTTLTKDPLVSTFGAGTPAKVRSAGLRADLTPKAQIDGAGGGNLDGLIPPGVIQMFAGTLTPAGWLVCDGSAVSRALYPDLFAAVGTAYGPGDGSTTFNLPNLTDRIPRGKPRGTSGGADTKTIGVGNLPPHQHDMSHDHGMNHQHTIKARKNNPVGANPDHVAAGGGDDQEDANNTAPNPHTGNTGGSSQANTGNGSGLGLNGNPLDVQNPWLGVSFIIRH